MDKFKTRHKSEIWLDNELEKENSIIDIGFGLLSQSVSVLERISREQETEEDGKFFLIGSISLAKSCHLLLGCYSLTLDGLGQEAGALLRPLIEVYELLIYLRDDKERVHEAISGNLPKAGEIAKKISGMFEDLRKYLNDTSSHFGYKLDSVTHLLDFNNVLISAYPIHDLSTFRKNLTMINVFQLFLIKEAAFWLDMAKNDNNELLDIMVSFIYSSMDIFSEET